MNRGAWDGELDDEMRAEMIRIVDGVRVNPPDESLRREFIAELAMLAGYRIAIERAAKAPSDPDT